MVQRRMVEAGALMWAAAGLAVGLGAVALIVGCLLLAKPTLVLRPPISPAG